MSTISPLWCPICLAAHAEKEVTAMVKGQPVTIKVCGSCSKLGPVKCIQSFFTGEVE